MVNYKGWLLNRKNKKYPVNIKNNVSLKMMIEF